MDLRCSNIDRVQLRDLEVAPIDIRHLIADILIIDRTDPDALNPLVYQLKQSTAAELENSPQFNFAWLRTQDDAFALLGEQSRVDKKQKVLHLVDGQSVSYNYLIIVTGSNGTFITHNQTIEFTAGVQSLVEALKMRREGLIPHSPTREPSVGKKPNVYTVSEESQKDMELIVQKSMNAIEQDLNNPQLPDTKLSFQVCV